MTKKYLLDVVFIVDGDEKYWVVREPHPNIPCTKVVPFDEWRDKYRFEPIMIDHYWIAGWFIFSEKEFINDIEPFLNDPK